MFPSSRKFQPISSWWPKIVIWGQNLWSNGIWCFFMIFWNLPLRSKSLGESTHTTIMFGSQTSIFVIFTRIWLYWQSLISLASSSISSIMFLSFGLVKAPKVIWTSFCLLGRFLSIFSASSLNLRISLLMFPSSGQLMILSGLCVKLPPDPVI